MDPPRKTYARPATVLWLSPPGRAGAHGTRRAGRARIGDERAQRYHRDPLERTRLRDGAGERALGGGRCDIQDARHEPAARPRAADRVKAPWRLERELNLDGDGEPATARVGWRPQDEVRAV